MLRPKGCTKKYLKNAFRIYVQLGKSENSRILNICVSKRCNFDIFATTLMGQLITIVDIRTRGYKNALKIAPSIQYAPNNSSSLVRICLKA
jgi:hypothetical protein